MPRVAPSPSLPPNWAASDEARPELGRRELLATSLARLDDVRCRGRCRHASAEECARATRLVFPYEGVFARHVGRDISIGDANQVLFFNADDGYRVSHPVSGGDACIVVELRPSELAELTPRELGEARETVRFSRHSRPLEVQTQALLATLRRHVDVLDTLDIESIAIALARLALQPIRAPKRRTTRAKRALVDRVKLVLADAPSQRLGLADIGAAVGASPVYLTQAFRELEGVPLYRYQRNLRLARALARCEEHADLAALALDVGFAHHSHFSATFRQAFGLPPSVLLGARSRGLARELLKILKV